MNLAGVAVLWQAAVTVGQRKAAARAAARLRRSRTPYRLFHRHKRLADVVVVAVGISGMGWTEQWNIRETTLIEGVAKRKACVVGRH